MPDFQLDEKRLSQLDGNIKQMISSGASEDDVMKYATDFKNQFGVKKKDGGEVSSPTESQLPSQKSNLPNFEQGQKIAERGFLMPEATPEQQSGSYANVGQNLRQKTVEKAAEIDAASLEFLRNLSGKIPFIGKKPEKIYENGELTEYGKNIPSSDFLGKAIKGINDVKAQEQQLQQTTGKLPETVGGEIVGGITSIAPDLALTAMTAGKNLFGGAGNLAAIGNAVTGAFVREQALAGAAKGYGEAEKKGVGVGKTLVGTLKESGKSAAQGALYELAGLGGSRLGNVLSKGLENVTAKEAVNLGARLLTFSFGVPTVESAISEGKLPKFDEILKNFGIAGAMEAFHLAPAIVRKINNLRTGSAVNNFMNAPADVIDDLVQSKQDAQNLNLTAMDAVKRAEGMEDGAEKSQLLKTASNLTQAADIKHVTDVIANSTDGLAHIAKDLPEDVRDAFMQKAQDIHQTLNPTELQKQGHAANISQAEEIAKQVEPLAKPENPNVLERIQAERKLNETKGVIDENTKNLNKVLDEQEKRNQQIQQAKLAEEGSKKYVVDGKEVSQEEFEAMQGKPVGTKEIITQEVKPTEVKDIEQRKAELQKELDKIDFKPLKMGKAIENKDGSFSYESMSDAEYKDILDKQEAKKSKIVAELKALEEVKPIEKVKPTEAKEQRKQKLEKAPISMKGVKALDTKELNKKAANIESSDARSAVLKYLTGGKLSANAIDELFGRKKGGLNTGERELKSKEAKARDYIAKLGEGDSLDDAAHAIWQDLPDSIKEGKSEATDTQSIKDELEKAISEYKTKSEATKALVEGYTEESLDDLERKHYEKYGNNAEMELDKELNKVPKNQLDIEQELINANYESEQQFQDAYWNAKETTNNFTEKTPSVKTEEAEATKGLEKAYKDLTIIEKRQIINSKFDELLEEQFENKIEKIC